MKKTKKTQTPWRTYIIAFIAALMLGWGFLLAVGAANSGFAPRITSVAIAFLAGGIWFTYRSYKRSESLYVVAGILAAALLIAFGSAQYLLSKLNG